MLDLVIRGGRVVTPWGVGSRDVAVAGEKIVAVGEPCTLQSDVRGNKTSKAHFSVSPSGGQA